MALFEWLGLRRDTPLPGEAALRRSANPPVLGALLVVLGALEACVIGACMIAPAGASRQIMLGVPIAAGATLVLYYLCLSRRPERANLLAPDFLFPAWIMMFHFPTVFFCSLGWMEVERRWWWGDTFVNKSMLLTLSGILSFLLGYNLLAKPPAHHARRPIQAGDYNRAWLYVGQFVLVIGVLAMAYFLSRQIGAGTLLGGKYGIGKFADVDPRGWFIGLILCPIGALIIACYSSGLHGVMIKGIVNWVLIGAYLIVVLLSGSRGPGVLLFAVIMFTYCFLGRLVKLRTVVIVGLAGAVLMSATAIIRSMGEKSIGRVQEVLSARQRDIGVLNALAESGGSMQCVFRTLSLIPTRESFFLGSTVAVATLRIMPNLAETAGAIFRPESPSYWLIRRTDPRMERANVGLGFSIIAESYMNFGILGPPLFLGILGFATRRLFDRAFYQRNPFRMVLLAVWMMALLNWVRQDSFLFVRAVAWAYIMLFTFRAIMSSTVARAASAESDGAPGTQAKPAAPAAAITPAGA